MDNTEKEDIGILYGFRKTLLIMILYVVGVVFRCLGLIDGGQMVDLFKSITVAFMAGNGLEHMTSTVKTYFNNQGGQNVDVQASTQSK
jgi:hypothetical protein